MFFVQAIQSTNASLWFRYKQRQGEKRVRLTEWHYGEKQPAAWSDDTAIPPVFIATREFLDLQRKYQNKAPTWILASNLRKLISCGIL